MPKEQIPQHISGPPLATSPPSLAVAVAATFTLDEYTDHLSGEQIVHALSGQLTTEYGKGFAKTNLFSMIALQRYTPTSRL